MKALITLFFVLALLLGPRIANADKSLKKNIFSDCPAAIAEVETLPADERDEFISYLSLVLKIPSQSPVDALADMRFGSGSKPVTEMPLEGMGALNTWRMFDPKRENEAKACAVTILTRLIPWSFAAVPEMYSLLGDLTLPGDLREALQEGAWKITLSSARDSAYAPSVDTLQRLTALDQGEPAQFGEIALIEHHRTSIPYLIERLRKPGTEQRDHVAKLLRRIDSGEGEVSSALLPLLNSGDVALRQKIVATIGKYETLPPAVIAALIALLDDSVPAVAEAALNVLREYTEARGVPDGFHADEAGIRTLVSALGNVSPDYVAVVIQLLTSFTGDPELLHEAVRPLLSSQDPKLRSRALAICGPLAPVAPRAFSALLEGLYDTVLSVRLRAIAELSRTRGESQAQVQSALLKLLKSVANERDPKIRQSVVLSVADAVSAMPIESGTSGFVAYFVEALGYKVAGDDVSSADGVESLRAEPLSTPATRGLLAIGEASRAPVIKALRHRDPLTRVRAAYVLGQLRPIDFRAVKELVALLADVAEAIQSEALLSLVRLGRDAAGEILKSLQSKNLQARQLAALALAANGSNEPRVSTLALEALRRSNCTRRIGLARAAAGVQGEFQNQFIESLADCVRESGSLRALALEMMRKIGALTAPAVEKITQFVRDPKLELSARLQILESLALERTNCEPVEGLLLELLDSADNPSKLRIIDIINRCSALSEQTIEKLFKVAAGESNEHLVRGRVYALLGRLKPENSAYSAYFLKELKSDRWQWALGDIARLPNEAEQALLVGALKDFPEELKHIPAEGLSHIEPVNSPISAETLALLLNGLTSADGQYRNQALIALIHLDPNNSVIPAALRRELEGRFRERVIVPATYREIPAIFDAIVAAPDSYVQFQAARKAQRLGK